MGFYFLLTVWEVFMPKIDLGLQILNFHFGLSKNQNKDMDLDGSIRKPQINMERRVQIKQTKKTWKWEVTFFKFRFWHGSQVVSLIFNQRLWFMHIQLLFRIIIREKKKIALWDGWLSFGYVCLVHLAYTLVFNYSLGGWSNIKYFTTFLQIIDAANIYSFLFESTTDIIFLLINNQSLYQKFVK